jgi:hypothetical protein
MPLCRRHEFLQPVRVDAHVAADESDEVARGRADGSVQRAADNVGRGDNLDRE